MITFSQRFIFSSIAILSISMMFSCSGNSNNKDENYSEPQSAIQQSDRSVRLPKLIDLGSKHCIPCKKMAPILDSLTIIYQGKAEIIFIDIKKDKQAARDYSITMIPTQVFIDIEGNEVYRHIGFFPADSITARFEAMGVVL